MTPSKNQFIHHNLQTVPIEVSPASLEDGRACDVVVDGLDITWEINTPEIDANVSTVAAYPGVRAALTQQQRRIGMRGRVVMVGRDVGTVVLPEADLKIYLDASPQERARRRHQEAIKRDAKSNYEEILAQAIERDRVDSTRAVAPLKPAPDAVILDSDQLNADQAFEKAYNLTRTSRKRKTFNHEGTKTPSFEENPKNSLWLRDFVVNFLAFCARI